MADDPAERIREIREKRFGPRPRSGRTIDVAVAVLESSADVQERGDRLDFETLERALAEKDELIRLLRRELENMQERLTVTEPLELDT